MSPAGQVDAAANAAYNQGNDAKNETVHREEAFGDCAKRVTVVIGLTIPVKWVRKE